jgi:beta-glucosidase
MTRSTAISVDGVPYRDLNGNGVMDPYEDSRLRPEERVADLVPRLSMAEKAGLLFHTILGVGPAGEHDVTVGLSPDTPREFVSVKLMNHFNLRH